MLHATDLVVLAAIKDNMKHLQENQDELELVLSNFIDISVVKNLMRDPIKYVRQAIDVINGKNGVALEYFQAYTTQSSPNYAIYVKASNTEDLQYMNDFGTYQEITINPKLYATENAIGLHDEYTLIFDPTRYMGNKIFTGLKAINRSANFEASVIDLVVHSDNSTWVTLNQLVPVALNKPVLAGWEFQSPTARRTYRLHGSGDQVNVQVALRTAGDIELHRVFAMLVRYCLKRGRQSHFEFNNFQKTTVVQSEVEQDSMRPDIGFETFFTVSGVSHDMWVDSKWDSKDGTGVRIIATPDLSLPDNASDNIIVADLP